jgi:hypothetical protein
MTPTDFEFTITFPGDARLVAAIRLLAVQAAGYANLSTEAGEGLGGVVERAADAVVGSLPVANDSIHVRFAAGSGALDVVISSAARSNAAAPPAHADGNVTVAWTTNGSHRTCHIRHSLPS